MEVATELEDIETLVDKLGREVRRLKRRPPDADRCVAKAAPTNWTLRVWLRALERQRRQGVWPSKLSCVAAITARLHDLDA
jgi:hypothetical protein